MVPLPAATETVPVAVDSAAAALSPAQGTIRPLQLSGVNLELYEELACRDSCRLGVIRCYEREYLESRNPFESGAPEMTRGFISLGAGILTAIIGGCVIDALDTRTPAGFIVPLAPATVLLVKSIVNLHSGTNKMKRHIAWERYHAN